MEFLLAIKKIKEHISESALDIAFNETMKLVEAIVTYDPKMGYDLNRFRQELPVQKAFFSRIESLNRTAQISRKDFNQDLNFVTTSLVATVDQIENKIISFQTTQFSDKDHTLPVSGFIREDIDTVMLRSAELIKKASHFRVVG